MAEKQVPVALVQSFVRASCALGHEWVTRLHKVRVAAVKKRRPRTLQLSLDVEVCPGCGERWVKYTETIHG